VTSRVSVALVGAGHMGRLHARTVAASDGARLHVVVDRHLDRAEALACAAGCRASTRFDDVFTADAAILATPPEAHVEAAIALLKAGLPVLVEKPLAIAFADVERLLDASEMTNVPLMGGFVERFNPAVAAAVRLLEGAPERIVARRSARTVRPVNTPVALDLLIHDIDLALRFCGRAAVVDVMDLPTAGHHEVKCRVRFEGPTTAWLSATRAPMVPGSRTMSMAGGGKVLHLDLLRRTVRLRSRVVPTPGADPLRAQLDHFLALHEGTVDAASERAELRAPHAIASLWNGVPA
jgi:predicted dehydrogenase